MKLIGLLITVFFFCCFNNLNAQLFEENFDYDAGNFSVVDSVNWGIEKAGSEASIEDGNLNYTNYSNSGIGRQLHISDSTQDYSRILTGSPNTSTVYLSTLLNVIDNSNLNRSTASGDYFINFKSGGSFVCLLYIRKGTLSTSYQLGIAKKNNTPASYLTSKEFDYGTTYLIVLAYTFNTVSDTDDVISLWINPDLSGAIPSPDTTMNDYSADVSDIDKVIIRQGDNTPNAYIDGMRAGTSWLQAPLPVELSSFSAASSGNAVVLSWQTSNEVNNFGFEIERNTRSADSRQEDSGKNEEQWVKIGFVNGRGNSNSPKKYSFIDKSLYSSGKYFYRLKQIDLDGKFNYSEIISVESGVPSTIKLNQNYPNPFNPSTVISYTLSERVFVDLKVYNVLGREIASIFEGVQSPGYYSYIFNGAGKSGGGSLAGGVYFCRLRAGNFSEVKKMIVNR